MITVHIERVVLEGFDYSQAERAAFGEALEAELKRLLTEVHPPSGSAWMERAVRPAAAQDREAPTVAHVVPLGGLARGQESGGAAGPRRLGHEVAGATFARLSP